MNKMKVTALSLAFLCCTAQASVMQVEAAPGSTAFLASASAYQAAVDAALLGPGHASLMVPSLDAVSHHGLFGGVSGFAMKSTVNFNVATAGNWSFRAGVDFGQGGAMFLDGSAVDFKANDMWWSFGYGNSSQFFAASSALSAGKHVLTVLGFEGCCDGGQQVQFKQGTNGVFTSFNANDGLNQTVPEPASGALVLAGLGLIGMVRRRKVAGAA